MKLSVQKSPKEIEGKFNSIKNKINQYVLSPDNFEIPPLSLFNQLETEFMNVVKEYKERGDQKNLLHVSHNFYWSYLFKHLNENTPESLKLFLKAFMTLLARHQKFPYEKHVLEKMLGTYELAIIKISDSDGINYDDIQEKFTVLIEKYISKVQEPSGRMVEILCILFDVLIGGISEQITKLQISLSDKKKLEEVENNLNGIIEAIKKINSDKAKEILLSKSFESFYKLKKRHLHYLVKFIFFESDSEKKQKAQVLTDKIIKEMISYSDASIKHCDKYIKLLPDDCVDRDNVKLMRALKEIDSLSSNYYQKAYSEKNIFQAWKQIDKIRHFLVKKYFGENIKLTQELLNFFAEEWALLDVFAKANLFRIEVEKRESIVTQKWEKEIFGNILTSLENIKRLFKYEVTKDADYQLKIISAQFSGGFSEYFIHDLFEEYYDFCEIDGRTSEDFMILMKLIKGSTKGNIKRNDFVEEDKPDIDIHIKNKCAVFLKNAKLDRSDFQQIKREFDLCKKHKIKNIFYAINFVKNLKEIGEIYNSFEGLKQRYTDLQVEIVDIKDMVEEFLRELKRSGKSKLNFSRLDLYKILDY